MKEVTSIKSLIILLLTVSSWQWAGAQTDSTQLRYDDLRNFTKKGNWTFGPTLTFNFKTTSDRDILVKYVDQNNIKNFSITLDAAYAFHDQSFVGMGLYYGQSESAGLFIDKNDISYTEKYFSNSYSARPFLKQLTPLDKKGRFNIISQLELWYQFDQSITQTLKNELMTRKFSTKNTFLLGVRPGINVFVIKNVAVETTLNVAGVRYSFEKLHITDQPLSKIENGSFDLKIDLLQLNLGIFVYL